jgi:hypothetical protein
MGSNDKLAATFHPEPAAAPYRCRDCDSPHDAKSAADECEFLDAIEARNARRAKG